MKKGRTRSGWLQQCREALNIALRKGRDYIRIPLTRGQYALIDIADYNLVVLAGPWHAAWDVRTKSYSAVHNKKTGAIGSIEYLSRFLLQPSDIIEVDHINHNTLDHRRANLRLATRTQNCANHKGLRASNTSGYIGVSWNKTTNKWAAYIGANGKTRWLGTYDRIEDAARARDQAARELHGEFATLNFPESTQARSQDQQRLRL